MRETSGNGVWYINTPEARPKNLSYEENALNSLIAKTAGGVKSFPVSFDLEKRFCHRDRTAAAHDVERKQQYFIFH